MQLTSEHMRSEWDYGYLNFRVGATEVWWAVIVTGAFALAAVLA